MKTHDLIAAMVEDSAQRGRSLPMRMTIALVIGGTVATTMFGLELGIRPDIASALLNPRFVLKMALALCFFGFALWASVRLTRPDAGVGKVIAGLAVVPALLATAVGCELIVVSPGAWATRAIGSNSRICLVAIPLLAVAPLATLLLALRAGAPRLPSAAGAVAGLLAGALSASLYAMHCTDDSPLFVALWYTPAVALVSLAGAVAGHRLLRW